ncbi:MAG: alpha/beta hydrolase, partial [Hyphomicrobiaceae bacterium]
HEGQSRGIAPGNTEKWDVVPVFYGTDRARSDKEKRIAYSADRGKRLEVGRALVTVPKSHRVPNIERPWVYKIPFFNIVILKEKEDPTQHFTLRELKSLTQDEFARLAQQRIEEARLFEGQALVFVHGFNTTFDYAVYRAAQLSYDLKFDGGSFVYSWPSRGEVSPTGYSADREAAEQAERYLEEYLRLVATRSNATSMTLIAHSMGNKLLLPVLQKLKLRNQREFNISQIILAAPDVDRDTFASLAKEIYGLSKGITLYAAANDRALDVSRQFWGGVPRAGDVPAEGPIVVPGIDTIDVTATSTEMFSLNHSGYAEKTELLRDISSLMTDGYRSPEVRLPFLIRVPTPAGAYWRFPQ